MLTLRAFSLVLALTLSGCGAVGAGLIGGLEGYQRGAERRQPAVQSSAPDVFQLIEIDHSLLPVRLTSVGVVVNDGSMEFSQDQAWTIYLEATVIETGERNWSSISGTWTQPSIDRVLMIPDDGSCIDEGIP